MYRFIAIIIYIFIAYIYAYAELPVNFYMQSEYKYDTIDYSDETRYYFREKASVFFSEESSFNGAYIYLKKEKENKYTWNLVLKDISPNTSFLIGNFFSQFGAGLLLGSKKTYNPDIFSVKVGDLDISDYHKTFLPCNTGNPMYAYYGIAGAYSKQIQEIKLSLNSFYSIKERFINENYYNTNKISSTMETLDSKTEDSYNQNEPVEIHTWGLMLSAVIFNTFIIQTYYINAKINSLYKEKILWDYCENNDESYGISQLNGFGTFAQYKDNFFNLLIEADITQKQGIMNNQKEEEYGYGILYGLKFTPPFISMSLAWKDVQGNYYSPYTSSIGEDYPESAFFFDTVIKPYTNLKLVSKASSEKRTAPSSADCDTPSVTKESIALIYSYGFLEELNIAFKRRVKKDDEKELKQQLAGSIDIIFNDYIKSELSAVYQYNNRTNASRLFKTGLRLSLVKYLKIYFNFIKAYISGDNKIYIIAVPIRNSSTQGIFVKENSNIIALKSELKVNDCFISLRYLYAFNQSQRLNTKLEFLANAYF